MSITREARYLSGNDLGKTFTATDNETGERVSAKIDHLLTSKDWVQIAYRVEGWWTHREGPMYRDITVNPQDPITITGQPSPATEDPHGIHLRGEPQWASLYRPLGFTTVDEALGTPGPAELPDGLCGNREDHAPHVHESKTLGTFKCHADQTRRLPHYLNAASGPRR